MKISDCKLKARREYKSKLSYRHVSLARKLVFPRHSLVVQYRLHPRHKVGGQQKRSRTEAVRDLARDAWMGWLAATDEPAIPYLVDDDSTARDDRGTQKPVIRQLSKGGL